MMRCLLIATAAAFAPPTRPSPRLQRLHAETASDLWKALRPRPHDVVLIDADNCRGKSKEDREYFATPRLHGGAMGPYAHSVSV